MTQTHNNTAVLFIDVINHFDFNGGHKLIKHTKDILPNMITLRNYAKKNNLPLIYINDHYRLWQADFNKIIDHCKNERSEEMIEALKPDEDDYFVIKPTHSAFFPPPLQSRVTEPHCDHLRISGVARDICLLFTAKAAYMYDFQMHIPRNCMASEAEDANAYALYLIPSVMQADVHPFLTQS